MGEFVSPVGVEKAKRVSAGSEMGKDDTEKGL